jgi:carbon-monoxide dehydrogenase medium subunit
MIPFNYIRPLSFTEACRLLSESDGLSKPLAGGTDLLVQIKQGKLTPKTLISLRDIPGLSFVQVRLGHGVAIGAMTSLDTIESSPEILKGFAPIAEASSHIASIQVRSRATIGGNLCNAAPSADMAPILIAYGAKVILGDGEKERTILLEDFFSAPGQTVLRNGELMREIYVPFPAKPSFATYLRASRSSMDIAQVGVGVLVGFDNDRQTCRDLRLVLGAVAPIPLRSSRAESMALGTKLDNELIETIAQIASEEAQPISDVRSTASYRRIMVRVLTRRALLAAKSWAQKGATP